MIQRRVSVAQLVVLIGEIALLKVLTIIYFLFFLLVLYKFIFPGSGSRSDRQKSISRPKEDLDKRHRSSGMYSTYVPQFDYSYNKPFFAGSGSTDPKRNGSGSEEGSDTQVCLSSGISLCFHQFILSII